ncbi:hypothetical protein ACEPAH_4219 [Sanghuangporus vaninii]
MSNTGYSSIIMIKPETGAPECWYWDINKRHLRDQIPVVSLKPPRVSTKSHGDS